MKNVKLETPQNALPFSLSVGQLAKSPFPTEKPSNYKGLTVGGQQNQNPHTHTRIREANFDFTKITEKAVFKLRKVVENDFLQTVPLLFEELENTKVVFHNTDYVNAIFSTYHKKHALLFLDWVKTFALIRSTNRAELINDVLQTDDEDFLTAFKLFKLQDARPKKKRINQKEQVWILILKYFPTEPFETKELFAKTIIDRSTVNQFLNQFKGEHKIKRCRKIGVHYRYQIVKTDVK
ncbi:MAG: hypothetical protein GKR88_21165 [Flavobacteriaceae bacterium]|nr:MAG: hypothetical protein GKR88_01430 [Flavobacteriaceae bacterium]QMU63063.1 MAG: hypothetical protein GKR88_01435 [Flavobacteriaceae bacterium]QMU66550.1 MAG: hypothetical protein GKR88_21160 [Flavobacteriaceae bacterium]QMU66551.1 MAG: hypothetical protein GKR88_21165 [Flavobacteriaceae bacterium]